MRPIKIDLVDGPCEICQEWREHKVKETGGVVSRRCDGCKGPLGRPAGYMSQTIHHYHSGQEAGHSLWIPITRELCLKCYEKDFAARYPGEPLPVLV
jgi:hypothetical protein